MEGIGEVKSKIRMELVVFSVTGMMRRVRKNFYRDKLSKLILE